MKLPLWGTILTLVGIAILCGLSTWQLQRLEWKQDMLAQIDAQKNQPFRTFTSAELTPENQYAHGEVEGHILYEGEIALAPRTREGESGYHIFTPLLLPEGQTILINRGWAPLDYKTGTRADDQEDIMIGGMLRVPSHANLFVPSNVPDKDQWYRLDLNEIAKTKGLENIAPVTLYEACNENHKTRIPDPCALNLDIPNNHFQYALFWFGMAIAMAVIYAIRFLIKPKK